MGLFRVEKHVEVISVRHAVIVAGFQKFPCRSFRERPHRSLVSVRFCPLYELYEFACRSEVPSLIHSRTDRPSYCLSVCRSVSYNVGR